MHAVVVRVAIKDFDQAREFLTTQVVPGVSGAPGFQAGYWTRTPDDHGVSMIVFESEDAAEAAKGMIEQNAPEDGPVSLQSADVYEVVASA